MGFDFRIACEDIEVDPHLIWFQPLGDKHDQLALGLRIGVPNYKLKDRRAIANAIFSILETGLGERAVATEIQHVELEDLIRPPWAAGYVALPELAVYLEWRKRKNLKI